MSTPYTFTTPRGSHSGYSERYIVSIIDRLGVCNPSVFGFYSVSGWNVFHFPKWIRKFEDQIQEDTESAKKKLLVLKISLGTADLPEDIAKQVGFHLGNYPV